MCMEGQATPVSIKLLKTPDDPVRSLRIFFLGLGLLNYHSRVFLILNVLINVVLWSLFLVALEYLLFNILGNGDAVEFYLIGVMIFCMESVLLYTIMSLHMWRDESILDFIQDISKPESNSFGRQCIECLPPIQKCNIQSISQFWITTTISVVCCNMVLASLGFGVSGLVDNFFPFMIHSPARVLVIPFLALTNFSVPTGVLIIRICSLFAHNRILALILYLEDFVENKHGEVCPLLAVMEWYDDLYKLNRRLSDGLSPYVTCSILIGLPQCVFLMQV